MIEYTARSQTSLPNISVLQIWFNDYTSREIKDCIQYYADQIIYNEATLPIGHYFTSY